MVCVIKDGQRMVDVIHQSRGRARFNVPGLRRIGALAAHLERELWLFDGIHRVSANVVTGHTLVLFSPKFTAQEVANLIGGMVKDFEAGAERASRTAGRGGGKGRMGLLRKDESPFSWHTADAGDVAACFGTAPGRGLSETEARKRLALQGSNALPGMVARSFAQILQSHITSLPVLLIGAAAGVSLFAGRFAGGLLALSVALLNAAIGAATESRAEGSLETVREGVDLRARVLRNGIVREIPFEECVMGDILDMQVGSRIPADARLIRAEHLSVDESALTGESIPVQKTAATLSQDRIPISQRRNMLYRGTLVVEGSGRAAVVASGGNTVLGRLQGFLGEVFPPEAVMARDLRKIARRFLFVALGAWGLMALIGLLRGVSLVRILRDGLCFIAGALPSGLSTLAVSAFALGHRDMSRSRILVRRLRALGNLASVQVVCFDKTGTLTHNRMVAAELKAGERHLRVRGNGFVFENGDKALSLDMDCSWLIKLSALCNQATVVLGEGRRFVEGSSTEKALVEMAEQAGYDLIALREEFPTLEVLHRTEERPFMATLHRGLDGRELTAVKGSPLDVLERCSHCQRNGNAVPLGEEERLRIEAENFKMAGGGLRVLGIAHYWDGNGKEGPTEAVEARRLVWAGLIGLADPVRKEAKALVQALHRAGIRTAVITGDQSLTAQAIGEELGLSDREPLRVLDVVDLKGLNEEGLKSVVPRTHVFARLNPTQKLQIIQVYQRTCRGVVMVGDGINDVLALKVADVGIAMGRDGTDMARQTADLVLKDDNLTAILAAVASGRAFYENMTRSVRYLSTTNHADILLELAAGGDDRFNPGLFQGVWSNLVCLALALEPADSSTLDGPPMDPGEGLMGGRGMEGTVGNAVKLLAAATPAGLYGLAGYGSTAESGALFARSLSVNQLLYARSCRKAGADRDLKRTSNRMLDMTLLGALAGYGALTLFRGPAGLLDAAALCFSGLLARALTGDPGTAKS